MKKIISAILIMAIVMTMSLGVFAADEATNGTITISGVSTENVYSVYRLLNLSEDSYDAATGAYSYTVNADWVGFFATEAAKEYIIIDSSNYATWVGDTEDAARIANFAKLALAWAEANDIAPVATTEGDDDAITVLDGVNVCKFENLPLGYYLIDSTMGSLCGLTTTNPNAKVTAKNHAPSISKQVQENSNSHWDASNTASIGDEINYRVTIKVTAGAQNYMLHDKMTEGLTFQTDSVVVTLNGNTVPNENNVAFTINTNPDDDCTFNVVFENAFCDTLVDGDELVISYSAILNEKALIGNEDADTNTAVLWYGEEHKTTESTVETFTYGIEIIKTDDQDNMLDGAEFRIYDDATGGNEIPVVAVMKDGVIDHYRLAKDGEQGEVIQVIDGRVKVVGFDNGYYYLQETKSPVGYNQLSSRKMFTVNGDNLYGTFLDGEYYEGTGVQVVNKTGAVLPSTGGTGTVLFITFGTIAVLGAGVLLVTKKRMAMIQD